MGEMPFIGAKISLISKGDIRYEGTLYSIDMNESTIALQNGVAPRLYVEVLNIRDTISACSTQAFGHICSAERCIHMVF